MSTDPIERVVIVDGSTAATWRFQKHCATPLTSFVERRLAITLNNLFTAQSELAVMIDQSIVPEGLDPLIGGICAQKMHVYTRSIRDTVARTVPDLPTHQNYLARFCPSSFPA